MNTAQVAKANRKRPLGKDMIAVNIVGCILIGIFAFLCVVPFYLIIIASFTSNQAIIQNGYPLTLKAGSLSLQSYQLCLKNPAAILQSYGVTIFVTVTGTFCAVMMACMTGYVLSRRDFPWRNKFAFFYFFTTLFNGGLVPWYLLCVRYLNFKNSFAGLLFPLMFSVWNMIIAKSFMIGLPAEITESAKLDGASDFTIFLRLIMPLSKPLVAYYLQRILGSAEAMRIVAEKSGIAIPSIPIEGMKMAMTVIATGPIVLLYPFVQRYFVKGLTIGAVKG